MNHELKEALDQNQRVFLWNLIIKSGYEALPSAGFGLPPSKQVLGSLSI